MVCVLCAVCSSSQSQAEAPWNSSPQRGKRQPWQPCSIHSIIISFPDVVHIIQGLPLRLLLELPGPLMFASVFWVLRLLLILYCAICCYCLSKKWGTMKAQYTDTIWTRQFFFPPQYLLAGGHTALHAALLSDVAYTESLSLRMTAVSHCQTHTRQNNSQNARNAVISPPRLTGVVKGSRHKQSAVSNVASSDCHCSWRNLDTPPLALTWAQD